MSSKEYIEREAAIAAAFSATSLGNSAFRDVYDTVNRLHLIPSADVAPVRHGRWIETKTGFHCSNCNGKAKGAKDGAFLSPYCPYCGAKLDLENDNGK